MEAGGLTFHFQAPASLKRISVDPPYDILSGPNHIAKQECAGICYET